MIKKVALHATYPTFFAKTPRIWTFQKIDPEISANFWFFSSKLYFFDKNKVAVPKSQGISCKVSLVRVKKETLHCRRYLEQRGAAGAH